MVRKNGVKVFAPATVSNVAVGFDILGFAIDKPGDEILVKEGKKEGLVLTKITGDKGKLPKQISENTATFAANELLKFLGEEKRPIEIEIHKKMGIGTGMGSSAASAVAAVMAINEYFKRPLEKRELLKFAMMGEQVGDGAYHADNVAPSLLGGIVLIRDNESLDYIKLYVPKGLCAVVIYPHIKILTKDSRGILNDHVALKKVIKQSGNIAALVHGLYQSDFDLISRCLQDHIIEPQRKHLIPNYNELKEMALKEGALGFNISGAGPSTFALCNNSLIMENIEQKARSIYSDAGIDCTIYSSLINQEGAHLY